ncbi:proteophosphoglycan ppg4 [Rhodotorula toruloides]|uniref:Structure-specific endonuclease subunit SLX4 n=1 Tax=Rhodotorula toruloides TaxID=5286 RepID=A0A511KJV4_RHOTO|nr:proteophosphoglycan ppg4 [Rhodotorula toruloides]
MRSDCESVISDSEPDCATGRVSAKKEDTKGSGRRRTSDERPGMSTDEAEGREVEKNRVIVLSSASEGEEPVRKTGKSGYLFSTAGKRRRVPSPTVAPDHWTAAAAPVASTSRSTSSRSSRSTSAEQAASAPFVSALDLLRSSTPQLGDSEDELKPLDITMGRKNYKEKAKAKDTASSRPLPTVKKSRSASVSSVEILNLAPSKPKAVRKSKTVGAASTDEDTRSTRSSSTIDSLPPPDSWNERSGFGSKATSNSDRSSVEPTSQAQRRKPWEALEAKPPKLKRKTAARKAAKPVAPTKEEEDVEELDSDPDGLVISSFKLTSVASSSTSSRPVVRGITASSLSFLPPPMELPADDRLRVLAACVVCNAAWPASKALASRQTHIRTCSTANDYSAETVRYLVDSQILRLAEEADGRRRADDEAKTLFDMAIGKGEGANAFKEVKVVGVEGYADYDPKEWYRAIKETQGEFDQARRKAQVAKVVKLAKEVKKERAEAAASGAHDGWKVVDESANVEKEEEEELVPLPTGRLKPESSTARNVVATRADELLAFDASIDHSLREIGALSDEPPHPTQAFEPSALTSRYNMPANPIDAYMSLDEDQRRSIGSGTPPRRRSRSPFRPLSLPDPFSDSDDGEGHHDRRRFADGKRSLWSVAAGRNDELLGRVVLKKPAQFAALTGKEENGRGGGGDENACVGDGGPGAEVASSEEEPLAKVVTATPRTTGRRKTPASLASNDKLPARLAASPSSSDEDSPEPTTPTKPCRRSPSIANTAAALPAKTATSMDASSPGMPNYDEMTVAILQREVAKYGFRKAREKAVLVRQMQEIWKATHAGTVEYEASAGETGAASPKKSKGKGKGAEGARAAPSRAKTPTVGRRKKKDVIEGDEALDPHVTDEEGVPLAEKIRQLIVADEQLYLRILRYEPVHLSKFVRLATENGVKIARTALMRFLDEQSITHYTQDPIGGPRRRYK